MEESYKKLIDGNRRYAMAKKFEDPEYFKNLGKGQSPSYLWIGCSDSRVPANEITDTASGEIFVHRNIANLVFDTDLNLLSVVEYAVKVLHVKHIIICGHYGCGGVKAAMSNQTFGFIDNWLRGIKEVYYKHQAELEAITDMDKRQDRLTELNVIEQVNKLARTRIVQRAWQRRQLQIHGWVYGINSGHINELDASHDAVNDVPHIFRYEFDKP
ncbi:MAG TPA: carbonic anhydrase [Flavobacteriales bacterium]|nr:carbonic anhydrase [Flavobacteriales bacterium]